MYLTLTTKCLKGTFYALYSLYLNRFQIWKKKLFTSGDSYIIKTLKTNAVVLRTIIVDKES